MSQNLLNEVLGKAKQYYESDIFPKDFVRPPWETLNYIQQEHWIEHALVKRRIDETFKPTEIDYYLGR